MSFVVVLLSLLVDQGLRHLEYLRGPRWFHAYLESLGFLAHSSNYWRATAGVLVIVLVPAVVTLFVGHLLENVWDVLGFLFALLILLFTLGPRDLHTEAHDYTQAVQQGDAARAAVLARSILDAEPPADGGARTEAVTRAVLAEANDRLFGVLFWFALLGPAGAVLYRSSDFLRRQHAQDGRSAAFTEAVTRLHGTLAWIPAHLAALGYALAGSFEDSVSDMKGYYHTCTVRFFQVNSDVLVCAGLGALRASTEETGTGRVRSALALVRRTLIIWLVVYALIALFGWAW